MADYNNPGGEAAFLREIQLISVAVHRNLLRLIGFCTTPAERILVYPFMENLSVAYRLRGKYQAFLVFIVCRNLGVALSKQVGRPIQVRPITNCPLNRVGQIPCLTNGFLLIYPYLPVMTRSPNQPGLQAFFFFLTLTIFIKR